MSSASPRQHRVLVAFEQADAPEKRDWKEYYFIQDLITGFNKDCLEIKKWSIGIASIVAVVGQAGLANLPAMLVVIASLALVFWVTETIWRMNQWAFIRCVRKFEEEEGSPQISKNWASHYVWFGGGNEAYREGTPVRFVKHFITPRTFLPHGLIVLLALVALATIDKWRPAASDEEEAQRIEGSVAVRIEGQEAPGRPVAVEVRP